MAPTTVFFGNAAPAEPVKIDPNKTATEKRSIEGGPRETIMVFPEDMSHLEIMNIVDRTWHADHSDEDPTWIESDNAAIQEGLAAHYPKAHAGRKPGWKGKLIHRPPAAGGSPEFDDALLAAMRNGTVHDPYFDMYVSGLVVAAKLEHALRVDAGRDFQSRVMGDTASTGTGTYASATYIGLTANNAAPAAGDTVLTGEITTAGGGLVRAQGAYAHTAGALTYTLTRIYTANASDALPVVIAKIGVFNAAAAGTMVFESLLSSTASLGVVNDQVQVTETVTI